MRKLKSCPFCGRIPEIGACIGRLESGQFFVFCHRCGCKGPISMEEKIAIRIWNRVMKNSKEGNKWGKGKPYLCD